MTMGRRIAAIALVYGCVAVAWLVLGGSIHHRTFSTDQRLSGEVSALWGAPQTQVSPELSFSWLDTIVEKQVVAPGSVEEKVIVKEEEIWKSEPVTLDGSDIRVDFRLDQRKKGLLWYSTYAVEFGADYVYRHREARAGVLVLTYRFPAAGATYDDFRFRVGERADSRFTPFLLDGEQVVQERIPVNEGDVVPFEIGYRSRGLYHWKYSFGPEVSRVKNFKMTMTTDFEAIDYPSGSISPDTAVRDGEGWRLGWEAENLISGFQLGMEMPRRLNPGPLAARISYFAPVSLGFFFVWIFVITLFRDSTLHPVNYLFLGAAFFAFHLLFAYTVDHIPLAVAFLLASAVSIFLVVSYLRLVVGLRFAAVEAGISQLIYLVLFAYAHFFEGLTGLMVTIGSILTLFALMQLTGRVDWEEKFRQGAGALSAEAG